MLRGTTVSSFLSGERPNFQFPTMLLLKERDRLASELADFASELVARSPAEMPGESDTERKTDDTVLVRLAGSTLASAISLLHSSASESVQIYTNS